MMVLGLPRELAGLGSALARHWTCGTPDGLRITSVRRSASRQRDPHPWRVALEVDWHDGARRGRQRLHGQTWRDGGSHAAWDQARTQAWVHPAAGPSLLHLPELDMLLWAWPNDPGLPQLPGLLDPAAWPAGHGPVDLHRHQPGQRASLRRQGVWAKTLAAPVARRLACRFRHFAQVAVPVVHVPRLIAVDAHTLFQADAPVRPLRHADHPADHAPVLAAALVTLHQAPRHLGGRRSGDHWPRALERRRRKLHRVLPEAAPLIDRVADGLLAQAHAVASGPSTLLHGDAHIDQFGVDAQGRLWMFDLDEMCGGDPLEDLAAVLSRDGLPPGFAGRLQAAYREAAPALWCAQRLRWHRGAQALLQATRAFVFQVPDWAAVAERRLQEARSWL